MDDLFRHTAPGITGWTVGCQGLGDMSSRAKGTGDGSDLQRLLEDGGLVPQIRGDLRIALQRLSLT
jgi:hypothetical protein